MATALGKIETQFFAYLQMRGQQTPFFPCRERFPLALFCLAAEIGKTSRELPGTPASCPRRETGSNVPDTIGHGGGVLEPADFPERPRPDHVRVKQVRNATGWARNASSASLTTFHASTPPLPQ